MDVISYRIASQDGKDSIFREDELLLIEWVVPYECENLLDTLLCRILPKGSWWYEESLEDNGKSYLSIGTYKTEAHAWLTSRDLSVMSQALSRLGITMVQEAAE